MPRVLFGPGTFHIVSRANGRATLFHDRDDYGRFVDLLDEGARRFEVGIYAFCVMPNHFHLLSHVPSSTAMSSFMQWWLSSHARCHHFKYKVTGHLFQNRYRSFAVQDDDYFLTAARYVLRNPVEASLERTPSAWPWSSLRFGRMTQPWPVSPPADVESWLGDALTPFEVAELRECARTRIPYGSPDFQREWCEKAGVPLLIRGRRGRKKNAEIAAIALADAPPDPEAGGCTSRANGSRPVPN